MSPGRFERKRALIDSQWRRSESWRKRAMRHLMADAHASEIKAGRKLVGFALADGRTVCVKERFRDAEAANDNLTHIHSHTGDFVKPVRAYRCSRCCGWHLTSQAR